MDLKTAKMVATATMIETFDTSWAKITSEYFEKASGASRYRDDVISCIHPQVISGLSDEQKGVLQEASAGTQEVDEEAVLLALRAQVSEMYLDRMYRVSENAIKVFYFVHDGNTLERLASDPKKVLVDILTKYIEVQEGHPKVIVDGKPVNISDKEAADAISWMLLRVKKLPHKSPVIWHKDNTILAFGHPQKLPEKGDFPVIREWFDSLTDGDAFAAWIYAVVFTRYVGRDVPWIYSPNKMRKSIVLNTLFKEVMDKAFQSVSAPDVKASNQFFSSQFATARMAGILDCKNPLMIMNSFVHQLTGRDEIRVEHKGEAIDSFELDTCLFITSNVRPAVEIDGSSSSRLFPLTFKSRIRDGLILEKEGGGGYFGDTQNMKAKVQAEVPAFLDWAEECYINLVDDIGYTFKFNETTKQLRVEAMARVEYEKIRIFKDHFVLDGESVMGYEAVLEVCRPYRKNRKFFEHDFIEYVRKNYGLEAEGLTTGEGYIKGIRLKTEADNHNFKKETF